jgi:NADH-quinone oxidoreductase subunit H
LLGSLRAGAQMLSYDLIFSTCLLIFMLITQSGNLYTIVLLQERVKFEVGVSLGLSHINFYYYFPIAIIFVIVLLAETNRAPFDLPEAESELVAGYNLEYSSSIFSFFFLGEYSNILTASILFTSLFSGGFLTSFDYSSF